MTARPPKTPTFRFGDLRPAGVHSLRSLCEESGVHFTYDGRGALYQLFNHLVRSDRNSILIPAFNCPTVVDPVIEAGFRPRYYTINTDLSVDHADFLSKLDSNVAAAVVINYFGFPADLSPLTLPCREAGVLLVEDCAHSFLRTDPMRLSGERADAAIFSFKKLIPSRVGGGIRLNQAAAEFDRPHTRAPIRETLVNCKQLFDEAVDHLHDGPIRRLYHRLESLRVRAKSILRPHPSTCDEPILTFEYPFDRSLACARMPWYARRIIESANIHYVASERRKNYSALLEGLHPIEQFTPVYKALPSTVCPWGFPILAHNRSSVDRRLEKLGVPIFSFGETMHSSISQYSAGEKDLLDKARYLSETLLLIAVRQGLSTQYFRKCCEIIHAFFEA